MPLHPELSRTGDERYLRMTRFWGKLLLINFALGVVTGIVQEFQFGMNWSEYSRFVGDVFGAPLAIEGLLAFFLESTFLGLWIFGWDRLPKRVHLAHDLAGRARHAAVGVLHPRRQLVDAAPGRLPRQPRARPRGADPIWEVLTNKTALVAFPHTVSAALLTAGSVRRRRRAWHLLAQPRTDVDVFRPSLQLAPARRRSSPALAR